MAIFTDLRLLFNSSHTRPSLENEERSLHQTWSVCSWSPMSMFGWVWRKSKIWPKMVILPHPRYGDFYCFLTPPSQGRLSRTKNDLFTKLGQCATEAPSQCLLEIQTNPKFHPKWWFCPTRGMAIFTDFACFLTPPNKRPYLENDERSLHQTWSVCYWSPMLMFAWVSNKSKIWSKMVILPHQRYGDFYCFLTPPSQGRFSRTKRDLFASLSQCATKAPCECFLEFQLNPKFDPKSWFCATRSMAIFTDFACFLTPPKKAASRERREISLRNFVSVLLKPHVYVWLSFKQIQNLTQNGDFAPPAVWRFLRISPAF